MQLLTNPKETILHKLQAVIFDMDGILIDSEPLWRIAELEVFHSYNIPLNEEMCIKMMGTRIDQLVIYYLNHFRRTELNAPLITNQIIDALIALINRQGEPMNGAGEVLEFCKSKNIPLGLASSSAVRIIQAILNKTGFTPYFQAVHSGEFEPYGKPHPAVYLTTAQTLSVDPYCCLAIEDSVNGVVAAKAARMKCVAVPEKEHFNDRRFGIADLVLPDLRMIEKGWEKIEELF